jgi:hypothetical protein
MMPSAPGMDTKGEPARSFFKTGTRSDSSFFSFHAATAEMDYVAKHGPEGWKQSHEKDTEAFEEDWKVADWSRD